MKWIGATVLTCLLGAVAYLGDRVITQNDANHTEIKAQIKQVENTLRTRSEKITVLEQQIINMQQDLVYLRQQERHR